MEISTGAKVVQVSITPNEQSLPAASPWLHEGVLVRVVLFLTIACYLPTLWFDFVYDDHYLLTVNPWMESWRQVPAMFTHSFWGFLEIPRVTDYYRPLVMLLMASARHLIGPAPGWLHLVVAGVHVLATYLVYRLARELLNDGVVAALAAGIFGLHPTKVETAAWISGVSDSLCLVFLLGSLIAYLQWKRAGRRSAWLAASLGMLLLALFSKEAAVLAPALIGVYELATADGGAGQRVKSALRGAVPYVVVVAVFWIVRMLALRGFVGASGYRIHIAATIWTAPKVILWYLLKQVWPAPLSVQYQPVAAGTFSLTAFLLPLVGELAAALVLARLVFRRPAGLFLTVWFLLTLAPVVVFAIPLQVHDRYAYLPSVATSIGIAYLIVTVGRQRPAGMARAAIVYLVLLALAAATFRYERFWDNDRTLFEHAVEVAPNSPDAYRGLILAHTLAADWDGAEQVAQSAVEHAPRSSTSWYSLGMAQADRKDYAGARASLDHALRFAESPKASVVPLLGLAYVNTELHEDAQAELCYRRAIALAPGVAALHRYLGDALMRSGKKQEAQQEFAAAKRLQ